MAQVTLKNLKKVYDNKVTAVEGVNLEIADKEFIVLVGPSGCGKSTTLRMVAGLEEISGGELYIDGKLCNDIEPKDRDIAMVFQTYALYPHMTVYKNMAFPLQQKKMPKQAIDAKVREVAEILGITEYLDRKPKQLSGGQRQRVAIGRAIVREPKVLLMDEPLSNLDAKLRNQMRAEIIKLRQRIDTTFMYVTHDQTEAMTLGDRIVIMKDGIVNQIGTPQELFDHPVNTFVAGFIGTPTMNFFDAELTRNGNEYSLKVIGATIPLSADMSAALAAKNTPAQPITLGVRPEHIQLCAAGRPDAIPVTVEVSEMMGSAIHVHCNAAGKDVVIIAQALDLAKENRGGFSYGSQLHFTFVGDVVHMFSKQTENNLL
ncbi:MAG: sn-glycerol-3-phosphate ABC transporter ATP-binding protein UgpC [Clostridia bacterium]|nr:sn-glycerol-3-phosphate ABC transporter ATP-binding protein UgpC [Clostridia bacterium]